MGTIALEFVPPSLQKGADEVRAKAEKVRDLARETGLDSRLNALLIPGIIEEEDDRPVPLEKKMDPIDVKQAASEILDLDTIVTQVTPFMSAQELEKRVQQLAAAGIHRIVFVGVPRTMNDGEGNGMSPVDALGHFGQQVPSRGCILIPTRDEEQGRFRFKLDSGANFALTQLLYSDEIAHFLPAMQDSGHRPEILLSMGYVSKLEQKRGLIKWLIQDETALARKEMQIVDELAGMSFSSKKARLLDIYKRIIDRVVDLGFPIGLHLESPYGFIKPAFETFNEMLEYWSPGDN